MLALQITKLWYSLTHPACWRALRFGVAPAIEHIAVLRPLDFDGLLDVGANRGQFSLACRQCHPEVPIFAFEPIPREAGVFQQIHGKDPGIELLLTALGDTVGESMLHLSGSADSSSLLPIGAEQIRLFPHTLAVGSLSVAVNRLDDLQKKWKARRRLLLKLDVQGYELQVLRGAREVLKQCAFVYVECSEVPLYDGQALRAEVEAFLVGQGFKLTGRYNPSMADGRLIQADYLFSR